MDALMETEPFWRRRVSQAQELVDKCNATCKADLSTRIKQDWLNSDRDLDGMRLMFSHFIPVTEGTEDAGRRPQPRHRVLLVNPHRPRDGKQVVFFPELIKPRKIWSQVIAQQNEDFGLQVNPLHHNSTQRNFKKVLQETVDRDARILADVDELDVAIGLDSFPIPSLRLRGLRLSESITNEKHTSRPTG